MKVKNVLKGLKGKYNLETIHIIGAEDVIYSGSMVNFEQCDPSMLSHKVKIEKSECLKQMVFNGRQAYLFIGDPLLNQLQRQNR